MSDLRVAPRNRRAQPRRLQWRPGLLAVAGALAILLVTACSGGGGGGAVGTEATLEGVDREVTVSPSGDAAVRQDGEGALSEAADVLAVEVSEADGRFTMRVTISSPDTGCDRYADWWEVLSEDGALLYRRVLLHSHVDEQPFTRSGGPVEVPADHPVIVRAHLNSGGYGGRALRGALGGGAFEAADLPAGFAAAVEQQEPLPEDCAF